MRIPLLALIGTTVLHAAGIPPYDSTHIEVSHANGTNMSDLDGLWMNRGIYGSPEFADWNNDGKKDLLIGFIGVTISGQGGGYMNVFLNEGSETEPRFTNGFRAAIQVEGG